MTRIVKKPEVRKLEIVKAAHFLFQTRDYDKTTMQDVMETLGIAKGTIYYYFASKEELLEAVINDIVDESTLRMQKGIDETNGNALDKFLMLVIAGNATEDNVEILEHLHRPGNAGMHARLLAVAIQKQAPLYANIIQQGCEEGLFQTETPLETAEFLLAAVQFLTDVGIFLWKQEDLIRRVKALPTLCETILKSKPGSFQFLYKQLTDGGESK
jgi:AcrR family transcriptional regulator